MKERPRILFITTQFFRGGAEMSLLHLFQHLPPQAFEVEFLVLNQLTLSKASSLIYSIPSHIRVHDPAVRHSHLGNVLYQYITWFFLHFWGRLPRWRVGRKIRHTPYDWAISYGEWVDPSLVATSITARHKAVWVHTDIDKSPSFDARHFFTHQAQIDHFLFASQNSMAGALQKWPFLTAKSVVVHNTVDVEAICQGGRQPLPSNWEPFFAKPVLVSVGNLRPEKNYPRQIEAMALLQKHRVDCIWLIVGSDVDAALTEQLMGLIQAYRLQERVFLLGADPSPYKYMAKASAVCVFSDYESWSLVITEALVLGTPVLATRTSGALQQIEHGKNGLLSGFTAEEIALCIESYLQDAPLHSQLCQGAQQTLGQNPGPEEFRKLVLEND